MTFDTDEKGVQGSRPVDLYTIVAGATTYRVTSYERDVVFSGNTFSAVTMSRGAHESGQRPDGRELIVYLPAAHAFSQRYLQLGIPPHEVTLLLQRVQQTSGSAIQQFQGYVNAIAVDGGMVTLRVPAANDDAWKVKLPVISAQRTCNHVLYDTQCQIARASFKVSTTISGAPTKTITVASMGAQPDQWAQFGEIVHLATGERRTIVSQVGSVLTVQLQIVEAVNGDAVEVYAGCDHTITGPAGCGPKFSNAINFGGMPLLNSTIDPFAPKGLGIIQQS